MNQKIKGILAETLKILIKIAIVSFSVATVFALIYYFRWSGWKGFSGFVVGVLITGFIFMSENPFIQVYRELILK